MKYIGHIVLLLCGCSIGMAATGSTYVGRVLSEQGEPLLYATVYLQNNPVVGTATNADGVFSLSDNRVTAHDRLTISCVGFQTQYYDVSFFAQDTAVVRLAEQPIVLATTTVDAKKTKQSKRKRLASILHEVYVSIAQESPKKPVRYQVVSDVKMDADKVSWGMEQMVAHTIQIPSTDMVQMDSIQFVGESCKRYCNAIVREHANSLLEQENDKRRKSIATAIDSGTIVHRKMWEMSQMDKSELLDLSDELSRWKMAQVDAQHTLLTYTRKRVRFLGIVKITESHSLVVDHAGSLEQSVQEVNVQVFLPFSIRLKDADLSWLNLLNMDDEQVQKFRLKKANMNIHFQTCYQHANGLLLPMEKTMHVKAVLEDNKKHQFPCELHGIQHVTQVQTEGVRPDARYNKNHKVPRTLVPIY